MKVYIVTQPDEGDSYCGIEILAVFKKEEDAKKYIDTEGNEDWECEEWPVLTSSEQKPEEPEE